MRSFSTSVRFVSLFKGFTVFAHRLRWPACFAPPSPLPPPRCAPSFSNPGPQAFETLHSSHRFYELQEAISLDKLMLSLPREAARFVPLKTCFFLVSAHRLINIILLTLVQATML